MNDLSNNIYSYTNQVELKRISESLHIWKIDVSREHTAERSTEYHAYRVENLFTESQCESSVLKLGRISYFEKIALPLNTLNNNISVKDRQLSKKTH